MGETYTVKIPKKWLKAMAPYYKKMLGIMKWVLPAVLPGAREILDETVLEEMETGIKLIKDYAGMLPGDTPGETGFDPGERGSGEIERVGGGELRLLREILGFGDRRNFYYIFLTQRRRERGEKNI